MKIQRGDFPNTVRNVKLLSVQSITIARGALAGLPQLEQLVIEDPGTLHVQAHGLEQVSNRLQLFSVAQARSVTIDESAFSGRWMTSTQVILSHIQKLTVKQHGFRHSSDSLALDVKFNNVKLLNLSLAAIAGPVSTLYMSNVHMSACQKDSLGGGYFRRLVFNSCNINIAQAGCLKTGQHSVDTVHIASTAVNVMEEGAFSGKIKDIRIADSNMTSIQTNGFNMDVEELQINNMRIDTLESRGLSVRATGRILLIRVSVKVLRRHALLGLTARENSTASRPAIRIHGLNVTQQADNGSLTFAACTPIEFSRLTVAPRQPQVCPTEQWTRQLTGVTENGRLTATQFRVYEQLMSAKPCTGDDY